MTLHERGRSCNVVWQVTKSHLAGVKLLLECLADPNASSTWLRTPLMLAASNNSIEICKLLIDHEAGAALQTTTQVVLVLFE